MTPFILTISVLSAIFQSPATSEPLIVGRGAIEILPLSSATQVLEAFVLPGINPAGDFILVTQPDGWLEKRNRRIGGIVWRTRLKGFSQSAWTYVDGVVYGGDAEGHLYAIDFENGRIKWMATSKGMYFSRPLVHGNYVFVSTSQGTLQSYAKETGEWQWQQQDPVPNLPGLWSAQGPVVFQGLIVAGFPSATLMAFRPQSGEVVWKESFQLLPGGADSFNDLKSVAADGEYLFASSFSGDLKAWKAEQGSKKLLWQKRASLPAPVTISNSVIYFSSRDGKVQAVDLETGYNRWAFQLPKGLGTQPLIDEDRVWVATSGGQVFCLSLDGKEIARTDSVESAIFDIPYRLGPGEIMTMSSRGVLRRLHLISTFESKILISN